MKRTVNYTVEVKVNVAWCLFGIAAILQTFL